MTIHASVELAEAMRGMVEFPEQKRSLLAACGAESALHHNHFGWGTYRNPLDAPWALDCPVCLALMEEARGPERSRGALAVRADELAQQAESDFTGIGEAMGAR